jgi:maleate cis-trans isomerase
MSSNTASMWAILRTLGIKEEIKGYGQIFTKL